MTSVNVTEEHQDSPFTVNGEWVTESQFQSYALNITQHIVIEACAGSGKTWLLTARMLRLLIAGVAPPQILAITFTRKATQEMKQRLADMLTLLRLQQHPERLSTLLALGLADTPSTTQAIEFAWHQAFEQGQWPVIATFHEWFAGIRRSAPYSLQAAPSASLTEDEHPFLQTAWHTFWQLCLQDSALNTSMKLAVQHLGLHTFEKAVLAVFARRSEWQVLSANFDVASTHEQFEHFIQAQPLTHWVAKLQDIAPQFEQLFPLYLKGKVSVKAIDRGHKIEHAYQWYEAQVKQGTVQQWLHNETLALEAALNLLRAISKENLGLPAASTICYKPMHDAVNQQYVDGVDGFCAHYSELHTSLTQCYEGIRTLQLLPVHKAILHCASHLIQAYQTHKLQSGVVDFNDLELEALSILRATQLQHAGADLPWSATRHVLLDEFQDTNPIQWQALSAFLLPLLQENQSGGAAASVFIVGDPKQSIYRFRRAEPALFTHIAQYLHEQFNAAVLRTARTRRNAIAINALVNATFMQPEQTSGLFSLQYSMSQILGDVVIFPNHQHAQVAETAAADNTLPVNVGTESIQNSLSTPESIILAETTHIHKTNHLESAEVVSQNEAQQVASALLQWKLNHPTTSWSEVMILSRKRKALNAFALALQAMGIPCVNDEKGGFFEQTQVQDMLALLQALHQPDDVLSTLHALRSPIFALNDEQLSQLLMTFQSLQQHSSKNQIQWCGLANIGAPWAEHAYAWLTQWQSLAKHLPVHDTLDAILHQGQISQRFKAQVPVDRRAWVDALMQKLLSTALDIDGGRYPSLARFLTVVKDLRESDTLSAQTMLSSDAVRLHTIHGAKGLEAELVVLVDTYSQDAKDDTITTVLDWPADSVKPSYFGVSLGVPWAGQAAQHAYERSRMASELEKHTVLYVAITRAKHSLWVSATQKNNSHSVYERLKSAAQALLPDFSKQVKLDATDCTVVSQHNHDFLVTVPHEHGSTNESTNECISKSGNLNGQRSSMTLDVRRNDYLEVAHLLDNPPLPYEQATPYVESKTIQLGKALHFALQCFLETGHLPSVAFLLSKHTLAIDDIRSVLQYVNTMVQSLQLNVLRTHQSVRHLAIESAWLLPNGDLLRPDVVVFGEGFTWLLDFKTSFSPNNPTHQDYALQLSRYLSVLPDNTQAYLLTVQGQCWQYHSQNDKQSWELVTPSWLNIG